VLFARRSGKVDITFLEARVPSLLAAAAHGICSCSGVAAFFIIPGCRRLPASQGANHAVHFEGLLVRDEARAPLQLGNCFNASEQVIFVS
jgi:hypothetical protein